MSKWIEDLIAQVIERDESLCINCDRMAADVHHIVPKGRAKKHSETVWRIENLCCLCRACHSDGQTVWMREKLIAKMVERYNYSMGWVREFGMVWERTDD